MNGDVLLDAVMLAIVLAPICAFAWVSLAEIFRTEPLAERAVTRIVSGAATLSLLGSVGIAVAVVMSPGGEVVFDHGPWFQIGHYEFAGRLAVDGLSAIMLLLSSALVSIGVRFSETYMHRDPGFRRYFALVALFEAGMLLLLQAGTIDLLFVGWELVGLTSTFLIAFFHGREGPLAAGLRAFVTYRLCDVGLLAGAVLLHHYAHTSAFDSAFGPGHWPVGTAHLPGPAATLIAVLFLVAAMGKSGAFPVGGWLPRAMEGPTPSSALFYGGLSVAAGVYLLLRVAPIFAESTTARLLLGLVGVATIVHATLVGRVQSDAKGQLAFAAATQIGFVFLWIALDLRLLAVFHLLGHISMRTYQLLRAPTLLHDHHGVHGALGGAHLATGHYIERILPRPVRSRLYGVAIARGGVDAFIDVVLVRPLVSIARRAERFETGIGARLIRPPAGRTPTARDGAIREEEDHS
jgi:NADH:ubiquinone oxidoreductase subunit 5 (subunit L)/multisubunit Na+/H+ antiporter MnhA subunit